MNVYDYIIVIMRIYDDYDIYDSIYESQVDAFAFCLEHYIALYIFLK